MKVACNTFGKLYVARNDRYNEWYTFTMKSDECLSWRREVEGNSPEVESWRRIFDLACADAKRSTIEWIWSLAVKEIHDREDKYYSAFLPYPP